jgi:hypothetical protein
MNAVFVQCSLKGQCYDNFGARIFHSTAPNIADSLMKSKNAFKKSRVTITSRDVNNFNSFEEVKKKVKNGLGNSKRIASSTLQHETGENEK